MYSTKIVESLYKNIITAGVHSAPSIKVAEASKILENTQRDLNISLMNEFAFICDKLEINTNEVIELHQQNGIFKNSHQVLLEVIVLGRSILFNS